MYLIQYLCYSVQKGKAQVTFFFSREELLSVK